MEKYRQFLKTFLKNEKNISYVNMSVQPRGATKIVRVIRNWLLRREAGEQLRYEGVNSAKRTQPLPNLPGGVASKMSANDYFQRDGRSMSEPPKVVYKMQHTMITSGVAGGSLIAEKQDTQSTVNVTPGNVFHYDAWVPYEHDKNWIPEAVAADKQRMEANKKKLEKSFVLRRILKK